MKLKIATETGWDQAKLFFAAYAAAFSLASAHVSYDYNFHRLPEIQQGETTQMLEVLRYKIDITGKEKELTLVGENHFYTKTENEMGHRLVSEHQHFANECGSRPRDKISEGELLYLKLLSIPNRVTYFYISLGSGRQYANLGEIAEAKGHTLFALEHPTDFIKNMTPSQRALYLVRAIAFGLTAPLGYYQAKNEKPYISQDDDLGPLQDLIINRRDKVMAKRIIDLLQKENINKLLAVVGRAHLDGIIAHLSENVELKEVVPNN